MPDAAAATFVERQMQESPFRGLAEPELVGTACECARRLADLAGGEPPPFPALAGARPAEPRC